MHVFLQKSPLCRSHFFEWLKTAISSNACGTSTLKSPLSRGSDAPHVHPRLRKRLARCTLDCGFKTPESPALRGFVAERCPIRGTSLYLVLKSNGLRHSKNLPVKFDFSPIDTSATIAKKLPPQRCFKPLLIPIFNFSRKRLTFALTPESGYTLGFQRRIAHSGPHGETGAFRTGPLSLPSERSTRFGNPAGQRCAYACRCPAGVAAPLGCVICLQLGDVAVFSLCAQYFLNVRGGGGITTLGAFHTVRKPCVARG